MTSEPEEIADLLMEINRLLRAGIIQLARGRGIRHGPSGLPLLRQVALSPGVTVNELSRRLGMAKSHVSGLVDSLQTESLLRKEPDRDDQRLVHLHLTDEGSRLWNQWRAAYRDFLAGAVRAMPAEQAARLLDGLRALRLALRAEERGGKAP